MAGTLTVTPAPLTITANNQTKVYGAALPTLTVTYTGLVNGDTPATFSSAPNTPPAIITTATASSHVSGNPYSITASGAVDSDYSISYVAGTLTVTPAPLTVTANNQTMVYGGAVPALTYTYTGLVNGDSSASFTGSLATAATSSSSAGSSYAITEGTLAATGNYTIGTFTSGMLTVEPTTTSTSTSTKLASSADPSLQGQSVTFTATVSNASSSVTPLGSVQFTIDGNSFGSPVPLTGNTASVTDSALGVGTHTVTAVYHPANGNFVTSTGSLTQTVGLNLGLLVLDPTGKDALTDTGNGGIVVEDSVNGTDLGAAIVVDSNNSQAAVLTGNASVTAKTIDILGGAVTTGSSPGCHDTRPCKTIDILGGAVTTGHGTFSSPVDHNFALVSDPVGLPLPPAPSTTYSALKVTGKCTDTVHVQPGTYVGGISISGNASVILEPGIYYMKGGGFSDTGSGSVTGNGVLIVNAPGSACDTISLSGSGNVTISAHHHSDRRRRPLQRSGTLSGPGLHGQDQTDRQRQPHPRGYAVRPPCDAQRHRQRRSDCHGRQFTGKADRRDHRFRCGCHRPRRHHDQRGCARDHHRRRGRRGHRLDRERRDCDLPRHGEPGGGAQRRGREPGAGRRDRFRAIAQEADELTLPGRIHLRPALLRGVKSVSQNGDGDIEDSHGGKEGRSAY